MSILSKESFSVGHEGLVFWKFLPMYLCTPKADTVFVQNHFFGNTSSKLNWLGQNFTGRHRVMWQAPLQTFGALRQTSAKRRRKKRILQTFCHQNNASSDSFRELLTQNVNRCCHENFFRNRISIFSEKGVIFPENLILKGFLLYTCGARPPALAFSLTANLSIAPYSQGCLHPEWLFSYDLPFSRVWDAKSPLFFGNFAKCCHISNTATASACYR